MVTHISLENTDYVEHEAKRNYEYDREHALALSLLSDTY